MKGKLRMKFSHFFINRPNLAIVISIFIVILGAISFRRLPMTQYPSIVPPTVSISARYAGASPEVLMNTVAAPIEEALNGVERMIYMQSQCGADGSVRINVTFETGTDPDMAQIHVQNRVSAAENRLPQEVRDSGITVRKRSPDTVLYVNVISPDNSRDKLYLTNYVITRMQDRLARVYGVGDFNIMGAKEYCMRIWMDTARLEAFGISPSEVVAALRAQNRQVAAGKLNEPPHRDGAAYELIINAYGRLVTEREFGEIVVREFSDGRIIRVSDVARVELGSYTYDNESYLNNQSSVSMGFFQLPEANAIETSARIKEELAALAKDFPSGVDYVIGFDVTTYISESINAVYRTIFEAVLLVVLVVMLFLQNWRAALIPLFAIPVSLIGAFTAMYAFGFSLNSLSLFGLVLSIGIVVDDAIVVVENVERNMREGFGPREATERAMTQVQGALIAIVLVLSAVFVPTTFLEGISGQFYRQFAITIASATVFSGIVSLTLTPALCAKWLRPEGERGGLFTRLWNATAGRLFAAFNRAFDAFSALYGRLVARIVRLSALALLLYALLLYSGFRLFEETPKGFIPRQDMGYILVSVQLPEGASFERTEAVLHRASELLLDVEGVRYSIAIAGVNATAGGARASNCGRISVNFTDRAERDARGLSADRISAEVRRVLSENIMEAECHVMAPPAVPGIGVGGDFKFMVQDRAGLGIGEVEKYTRIMAREASMLPEVSLAFSSFRISNPQLYAEIDRLRAQKMGVSVSSIFDTLQYNLGSVYVNDFNLLGRVYRVVAQAEGSGRSREDDVYRLRVPSSNGSNVPLGSVMKLSRGVGPDRVVRYNLYPSADIQGNCAPGYSTGQAIAAIEELAARTLPPGMGIEWTDLAYQQQKTRNTAMFAFSLSVIFVFLLLVALYESWTLPLAVILVVPLVLLFAILGVHLRGMDNNIMTQIGFVVLIGLACKNAILIVEFAHQREMKGEELVSSITHASQNRLRPIVMTSLAFILGVAPLAYGSGAGYELREALGTSVLYGMMGVTVFGCLFTPVFYYMIRRLARRAR